MNNNNVYPYMKEGITWGFGPDERWPPGYAAKVISDQHEEYRDLIVSGQKVVYLEAGQVTFVDSDNGNYLVVQHPTDGSVVPVFKSQVIPVPNFLQEGPEEIEARLPENQRLVSDLVDDGYQLDRALTEEDGYIWSTFFGGAMDVQRPFGLWYRYAADGREVENTFYLTSAWPTAVSVATEL